MDCAQVSVKDISVMDWFLDILTVILSLIFRLSPLLNFVQGCLWKADI